MRYCTSVTLRPRTMDELTKLTALLLVHNLHRFPALTCLRLELLVGGCMVCVYERPAVGPSTTGAAARGRGSDPYTLVSDTHAS